MAKIKALIQQELEERGMSEAVYSAIELPVCVSAPASAPPAEPSAPPTPTPPSPSPPTVRSTADTQPQSTVS